MVDALFRGISLQRIGVISIIKISAEISALFLLNIKIFNVLAIYRKLC